jgi:cadmium resistance protein CadD (predicted permease)
LFVVSVVASLLTLVIPRAYLGLLGIAPILIGTKKFLDLYRQRDKQKKLWSVTPTPEHTDELQQWHL